METLVAAPGPPAAVPAPRPTRAPALQGLRAALRQAGAALLDFVFPPVCLACGGAMEVAAERLCPACWAAILQEPQARCRRCGCPLQEAQATCANCAGWETSFERAVVLGRFAGPMQQAVHALKFGGHPELGPELGRRMARALGPELDAVDLLVPVPLHPARQRERGYNQSVGLACGLSLGLAEGGRSVPVEAGLVRRCTQTRQQARLGPAERRANLAQAFACTGAAPASGVVGLVDDVLTTGATLDACARVLCQGGAARVWALALASPFNPPCGCADLDPIRPRP
ncbi:MAG: ComF family protein [Candidatus Latescibacterota bacterium]